MLAAMQQIGIEAMQFFLADCEVPGSDSLQSEDRQIWPHEHPEITPDKPEQSLAIRKIRNLWRNRYSFRNSIISYFCRTY